MLAARKVGAPLKWVEDRRENLLAAGKSRHEHADVHDGVRRRRRDPGRAHRLRLRLRRVPDAVAGRSRGRVGMLFPGPYRVPAPGSRRKSVYTNTVGRTAYRGPWQFETLAREVLLDIAARQMGIDPVELRRRNLLRAEDLPYANAERHAATTASRPLETFEQALAMLDYDAFRAEQAAARAAGRYLGVGLSTYVEPSTPGYRRLRDRGARRSASSRRARSTSTSPAARPATASRRRSCSSPPTRSASTSTDVNTIQGDTAVTGFGAGAAGSRSGSMTAGAMRETAAILRERIVRDRRAQAGSRARGHRARPTAARACAARPRSASRSPRSRRWPTSNRRRSRPACRPGSRRARATPPTRRSIWVNATHVCTCEVDVDTGGSRCCATS